MPDYYADAEVGPAVARLVAILIGMAIIEPVLLAWHAVAPGSASKPLTSQPSDE